MLGLSQDDLAAAAKVAKATIANFELGKSVPYDRTLADIRAALEQAGVDFIPFGDEWAIKLRQKST